MDEFIEMINEMVTSVSATRNAHFTKYEEFMAQLAEMSLNPQPRLGAAEKTPQPTEKRTKILDRSPDLESADDSVSTTLRPVRTVRVKAISYKEPNLVGKLRQPAVHRQFGSKESDANVTSDLAPKEKENQDPVEIMPTLKTIKLERLSEEEMPPPAILPPKKIGRKPKQKSKKLDIILEQSPGPDKPMRSTRSTRSTRSQLSNKDFIAPDKIKKEPKTSIVPNKTVSAEQSASGVSDTTFVCAPQIGDCSGPTAEIANETATLATSHCSHNSLITDDESDANITYVAAPTKTLSTPSCKATAPKRASIVASPGLPPQRMTRTKTLAKEIEIVTAKPNGQATNTGPQISQALEKPQFFSHCVGKLVSGISSKLPLISSSSSAKVVTSAHHDTTAEDGKPNLVQALLDEKKKKREEKQRLAQTIREEKERKRVQLAEKAIRETEEKLQRLAEKREKQRQLEIEKKRVAQVQALKKELQKKQQTAAEKNKCETLVGTTKLTAAAKLAGPSFENNAIKCAFDMLDSGDSTDDESKPVSVKHPKPPVWSQSGHREHLISAQATIPTKIIDTFFSVQPMTPNLMEIFPSIDVRKLKRNSSVMWRTPPRYSQMPKY